MHGRVREEDEGIGDRAEDVGGGRGHCCRRHRCLRGLADTPGARRGLLQDSTGATSKRRRAEGEEAGDRLICIGPRSATRR